MVFPENLLHPTSLDCEVKAMKETKSPGVFKSSGPVNCLLHMTQDFSLLPRPCGTLFVFSFQFVSSLRAKSSFSWEFLGIPAVRTPCFHLRACSSIPGQETKILQATYGQRKKKKRTVSPITQQEAFLEWGMSEKDWKMSAFFVSPY